MSAPFTWDVHVRFNDCDGMRHVNNAVYLSYVEDARIAYFQSLQPPDGSSFFGRGIIVARTEVDYLTPAMFGRGPVTVTVRMLSIGRRSFRTGYEMRQNEQDVARAVTVLVAYDYKTQQSRPLDDIERVTLEQYIVEAPAGTPVGTD